MNHALKLDDACVWPQLFIELWRKLQNKTANYPPCNNNSWSNVTWANSLNITTSKENDYIEKQMLLNKRYFSLFSTV